jgi:hypothetical protein
MITPPPPSRAFSPHLRPPSPALLLAAGFFVLTTLASAEAQSYTCPHGIFIIPGTPPCVLCSQSAPSGGAASATTTAQQTGQIVSDILKRNQHRRDSINNPAPPSTVTETDSGSRSAVTSSRKPDGYDTRQVSKLMGGHGTPAYMGTETEYTPYWIVNGVKQYSAPTADQLAAEQKSEAGRIPNQKTGLTGSKIQIISSPGSSSPAGASASAFPVGTQWVFDGIERYAGITVSPSGAVTDRDGYLVEFANNTERDAYLREIRAGAEQYIADRLREENAQADWQRMQKKALQDFTEGMASGSLTWEDHPAKHGYTAQEQATYWAKMRQRIDDRTAESLKGTGYDIRKVKSDARDVVAHWERTHLQQTMTEYSDTHPWFKKTITEAERDPAHVQAVKDIRAGLNLEMGSRPAFGPGSNENNGGPTASPPVKP